MCDVPMCDGVGVEELPGGHVICADCQARERRVRRDEWLKMVIVPTLVVAAVLAGTVVVLALQQ